MTLCIIYDFFMFLKINTVSMPAYGMREVEGSRTSHGNSHVQLSLNDIKLQYLVTGQHHMPNRF